MIAIQKKKKKTAFTASIFRVSWPTSQCSMAEIKKNQTFVGWLTVSDDIHFEPDGDSEDKMEIVNIGQYEKVGMMPQEN